MAFYNRRLFLQSSAAGFLGAAGALSALSARPARAASTSGYKAMVCLFLKGGMDAFDVLMPYDEPSHSAFTDLRLGVINAHTGAQARSRDTLLAVNPANAAQFGGRQFALSPELAPIHSLFNAGEAAVVGNVGPLLEPTTRAGMDTGQQAVPNKLFSHNDQQSTWMALNTEGTRQGWGGRFSDRVLPSAARPEFAALSASSMDVFLSGEQTRPFRMPSSVDSLDINVLSQRWRTSGGHGDTARALVNDYLLDNAASFPGVFGRDVVAGRARGLRYQRDYVEAFQGRPQLTSQFPETGIGRQLQSIANSIHIQSTFGNPRQIFYATMGGFDTHDSQSTNLPSLMSQLAEGVAAFRAAMREAGQWDDVAVFTMSDFGRTLTDNGNGTDHGWGSHHFVFGGSVQGNNIYGGMPELTPGSERFTQSRARLIPDVSVEQYAATLGRWFGLDEQELDSVLPNLGRFESRDLGVFTGTSV